MTELLKIREFSSIDVGLGEVTEQLRRRLSPQQGDVVSQAGRQRTMEIFGEPLTPSQVVQRICDEVCQHGIDAVLHYSSRLDRADLTRETIRVPRDELQAAHDRSDSGFLDAVRAIRDNIAQFQQAILHQDVRVERPNGVTLTQRYVPLARAGICVPGGAAAYPSTVLMTAVPAQVAGVEELVVVAPPTPFGAYNDDILATCHELGLTEVYRIGGAQAVAAMAYGVEGLRPVDKIVGPGNTFVALAKKLVYGHVDIDSIAGPSEVIVIADETTPAKFTAADLLAQAEHAPGASILVTWVPGALSAVRDELRRQVATLSRRDLTRQSLEDFGSLVLVRDRDEACRLTNALAPEHLHIATSDCHELVQSIRHAGATFLGAFSPVALGDYAAGPSHVLPTGGTARWASGLTANDFLRGGSVMHYTEAGMRALAPLVQVMADREQLTAHRASVDVRLEGTDEVERTAR